MCAWHVGCDDMGAKNSMQLCVEDAQNEHCTESYFENFIPDCDAPAPDGSFVLEIDVEPSSGGTLWRHNANLLLASCATLFVTFLLRPCSGDMQRCNHPPVERQRRYHHER